MLTDFLVRSFARTVLAELGLDRHPELRDAYFGNYTRVVWLAQQPTADLRGRADDAATALGLPLAVVEVGDAGLERALETTLIRRESPVVPSMSSRRMSACPACRAVSSSMWRAPSASSTCVAEPRGRRRVEVGLLDGRSAAAHARW